MYSVYKTLPIECVLVISETTILFDNSGLYFHPPITIITSKKIIILTNKPIGICAELVEDLKYEIGYLISKGGITTNLILSNGLNADYVYLEGQILTGISVVTYNLKNGEKLPIVTHPGNIGTEDSLVNIWKVFESKNNF